MLIDSISIFSGIEKTRGDHKPSKIALTIEEGFRGVREEVTKVTDLYDTQKAQIDRFYVNTMKDTQCE
jgi:hypothetical protein